MRAIDDDTDLKLAVLRKLREWGALPESDLSRMLSAHHLTTDDFREMEAEGLIEMTFIGDEYVVNSALLGRLLLEQHGA